MVFGVADLRSKTASDTAVCLVCSMMPRWVFILCQMQPASWQLSVPGKYLCPCPMTPLSLLQACVRETGLERRCAQWDYWCRTAPWCALPPLAHPSLTTNSSRRESNFWNLTFTNTQAQHLMKGMVKHINEDGAALSASKEASKMQAMANDAMI